MFFEDLVAIPRLSVEAHGIRQAGAAAALDADAQAALFRGNSILLEQLADFPRGTLGQMDFRDVGTCDFCWHFQMLQRPYGFNHA